MTTINIYPTDDTYIQSNAPNTIRGSETKLTSYYSTSNVIFRSLLSFSIPQIEGDITSINLYLYRYGLGRSYEVSVHKLFTSFNELTTTWLTPWMTPGGDFEPTPILVDMSPSYEWFITPVPLTDDVLINNKANFLIKMTGEGGISNALCNLVSKDATSTSPIENADIFKPYLEITYEPSTCAQLICNLAISP